MYRHLAANALLLIIVGMVALGFVVSWAQTEYRAPGPLTETVLVPVGDPATPLATREEALILASIIEKETGLAEERPQVASVFVNRLNKGMQLQTDPTVIYGITNGVGTLGRGLRRSELNKETPYNTYVIPGLPPGPIANPGKAAIEAALNPAETEYIFFVADGTGGHAFSKTLDEHNSNVAKWRQIEAKRAAEAEEAAEAAAAAEAEGASSN